MDDQRTNRKDSRRAIAFSIKRLLIATAFCAVGWGMVVSCDKFHGYIAVCMLIVGFMLIGAGALLPFRHPIVGAGIGAHVGIGWVLWDLAHFHT